MHFILEFSKAHTCVSETGKYHLISNFSANLKE